MRLVERAGEVRAGVGQLEAFAPPQLLFRQAVARVAVALFDERGHEVLRVELVRRFEKHAGACFCRPSTLNAAHAAYCSAVSSACPWCASFFCQPRDVAREGKLGEGLSEERLELPRERRSVDAARFVRLHLVHGFALHEVALHAIKRRELMVTRGERADFAFDAEEPADEGVDVRRQRDQKLRFLLRCERRRTCTRGEKSLVQRGLRGREPFEKQRVDAREPVVLVQIEKRETRFGNGYRVSRQGMGCSRSKRRL